MSATPDAIDLLLGRDSHFRSVAGFRLRGREFTLTSGCVSNYHCYSVVPAFNSRGTLTKVKVREGDKLTILSRYTVGGYTVPEEPQSEAD